MLRNLKSPICSLLFVAATGAAAAACAQAPTPPSLQRFEFAEPHMGTLFGIVLYASGPEEARRVAGAAFRRVAELDLALSDYNPESELMRLSRHPPGTAVAVSAELFAVLLPAQKLAEATAGAFDVTLGPLVRLWREAPRHGDFPAEAALAAARRSTGYRHVRLISSAQAVALEKPGMQLDLGGIAKGYAADAALGVLRELGHPRALVAAGGDLAVGAPPPGLAGWRVAVPAFDGPEGAVTRTLLVAHAGVSTSGDSEQFVLIGGVRYSHILDPHTGLGLINSPVVTVIAADATASDSLATACSVLPADLAAGLLSNPDGPALAILRRPEVEGKGRTKLLGSTPPGSSVSLLP
jgi:FAD:protein FMN transferase